MNSVRLFLPRVTQRKLLQKKSSYKYLYMYLKSPFGGHTAVV